MFINNSQSLGVIINAATTDLTGSLFLSLLGIVAFIIFVALLFRIPLAFTAILIMPMLLSCMAYFSEFLAVGGVMLIYLALILARHFWIQ